jgi:hypothetical protein
MAQLRALTPACGIAGTDTAQRFLASAYDSVDAVLETLETMRGVRRQQAPGGRIPGRLTSQEEDLLRAAIVFTGAGLDATMKQLIRDTLATLLEKSTQAHDKFETFTAQRLGAAEMAESKTVARYLVAADPRGRLIEDYVYELTGSSLQSAEQVGNTAGALGIDDPELRRRVGELKELFTARNEVSHELDLQRPEQPGDRTRRTRSIGRTKDLCQEGLEVAQLLVNAVGALLDA